MTKLRKALVVGVMSITVLSMSVIVAPEADAAAVAGDLIKMDGLSSVYYLAADGKRYVFPNEATYFSWYSDFSGVVTIPQSELETYQLGANVTMRPGTKLVKIQTDPKVYAVEPNGNLLWVPSETVAIALFGTDWAARVVDVADAFFTNYTVTTEEVSETAYPAGSLVKFGEDATVYYIDAAGTARPIADEAAFLANRFKWDDIVSATIDKPTEGTPVSAAEGDMTDTSSGAGGTANAGTGLTVAIAGDTPASVTLPSLSDLVPFTVANLTASNDGDVTVQNMTFTRRGVGSAGDFDGGYLFVGDTRLTSKRNVNTSDNKITFTALNLNVPAGMTKAVTLKLNSLTGKSGNHYFEVSAASDIVTNGAVVSGSFPVAGNTMAYSAVDAATVTLANQDHATTYKIGETDRILVEFEIDNDDKEDVDLYRIRLKNNDTAGDDSISNLSLEIDGNVVKTDVAMEGKYIDFVLDTPYTIEKNKTNISCYVYGDIVGDINKYLDFYLKNVADVDARGTAYGGNYSANVIGAAFDAVGASSAIKIEGSEIDLSFDGPQTSDIKDDVDDVVLANFKIKSNNLDINIETLEFIVTNTNHQAGDELENFEMVDEGNNIAYSITSTFDGGAIDTATFENVYLQKGIQYNFELRGDVPEAADEDDAYSIAATFTTSTFDANYQDEDETAVAVGDLSTTAVSGKTMTVKDATYTLSAITTNANTVVKEATNVLLFKGKVTASNVDDLKVSKLRFDGDFGFGASTFDDDWNRIRLYKVNSDSTETELDDETSLANDYVSFSGFTLDISKGASNGVTVVVRADVKSTPAQSTTTAVSWNTSSGNHTVKDSDNNAASHNGSIPSTAGGTITVASEGTYTMTMDTELTGINNDKNVLAGSMPLIGRLKMTAAKEAAILEDLVIGNSGTANNDTIATLYLYDNADGTGTPLGSADVSTGDVAFFEDVNIEVPMTGSTYMYIFGMVKAIDYSASPGADSTGVHATTIELGVPVDPGSGVATKVLGSDTGEEISASSGGPNSTGSTTIAYVYGATVSNVTTDFANATLVEGVNKEIFSFKVTVPSSSSIDPDGDGLGVKIATTTFTVASTSNVTLDTFKIERVGGANSKQDAKFTTTGTATAMDFSADTFTIDLTKSYGSTEADLTIRPGDTAEYRVYATVSNLDTSDSLQVSIISLNGAMDYQHETGTLGTPGADTVITDMRLTGDNDITGGTLSN